MPPGNVLSRMLGISKLNMGLDYNLCNFWCSTKQKKGYIYNKRSEMTRMDQTNPSFVVNENKSFPLPLLTISKVLHLRFSSKFNAMKGFSLLNLVLDLRVRSSEGGPVVADKLNYLVIVGP